SVRSAPNAEPAPPSCCRPATPKLCSFTSMRSQPKSLRALTLFSSSIKPAGMAPRPSRFQTTSRSCSSRHALPNSTAKKISGNSCGRTGCRTEFSNPSTTSSITAATPGTRLSISRGKSCPSRAAIGPPQVTQSEDWYKVRAEELRRAGLGSRAQELLQAFAGIVGLALLEAVRPAVNLDALIDPGLVHGVPGDECVRGRAVVELHEERRAQRVAPVVGDEMAVADDALAEIFDVARLVRQQGTPRGLHPRLVPARDRPLGRLGAVVIPP